MQNTLTLSIINQIEKKKKHRRNNLPDTGPPLGHGQHLLVMPLTTKMHPPHSCKEAKDQLKTPFPEFF